jgi:hypothetical protein
LGRVLGRGSDDTAIFRLAAPPSSLFWLLSGHSYIPLLTLHRWAVFTSVNDTNAFRLL